MILLVPVACLALLALWTWLICQTLIKEQSYLWLTLIVVVPPIGVPAYLVNFYILGDDRNGLSAIQRRSTAARRAVELRQTLNEGDIMSHRLELAEILLEQRDYPAVLAEIQQILARDSEDLQAHFLAARTFVASGKPAQALAHLDFICTENPSFSGYKATTLYAVTLHNLGRHDEAGPVFETLLDHHGIPEVLYHYALHLQQTGRGDEATKILQQMVSEYKKESQYYAKRDNEWLRRAKSLLRK